MITKDLKILEFNPQAGRVDEISKPMRAARQLKIRFLTLGFMRPASELLNPNAGRVRVPDAETLDRFNDLACERTCEH